MEKVIQAMIEACQEASKEVMRIYKQGFHVIQKEDFSPVTEADLASNKIIRKILSPFKEIAWLSEEDKDEESRLDKEYLFIIDPLDGTQDFVNHDDEFGINIALVKDHRPIASVVGIPAKNAYSYAIKDKGAYYVENEKEERLHVSTRRENLIMVQSKTHNLESEEEIIHKNKDRISKVLYLGASTKAVSIAKGEADCSIRFTDKTKEWDTCAPELIVLEAGGIFLDSKLRPFTYNRKDVYNHDGYCMFNRIENTDLLR